MVDSSLTVLLTWIVVLIGAALIHKIGHLLATSSDVDFSYFGNSLYRMRSIASSLKAVIKFFLRPYVFTGKKTVLLSAKFKQLGYGAAANAVFLVFAMTILALVGTPSVTEQSYQYSDAEVLLDELRVTASPQDSDMNALLRNGSNISKIGSEHIRDSQHLEELLVHFTGRQVLIDYTYGGVEGRQSLTVSAENRSLLKSSQAIVTSFGWSAPIVGVLSSVDLVSSSVTQTLDTLLGTNFDSNDQKINQRIKAYGVSSFERIGIMAALASISVPFMYLALLITAALSKPILSSSFAKRTAKSLKSRLTQLKLKPSRKKG